MSLSITEVRVDPVSTASSDNRLLGYANIVFNGEFAVHNIRIVRGKSGVILAMPNRKLGSEYEDLAHPITRECRIRMQRAIIDEYNRQVGEDRQITDDEFGF